MSHGEKRNRPAPPPERGLLVPGPSPGPEAPLFPKPLDLGQHWVVVRRPGVASQPPGGHQHLSSREQALVLSAHPPGDVSQRPLRWVPQVGPGAQGLLWGPFLWTQGGAGLAAPPSGDGALGGSKLLSGFFDVLRQAGVGPKTSSGPFEGGSALRPPKAEPGGHGVHPGPLGGVWLPACPPQGSPGWGELGGGWPPMGSAWTQPRGTPHGSWPSGV